MSKETEQEIVDWILESARLGQPRSGQDVRAAAWSLSERQGNIEFGDDGPSKGWLFAFLKRHPELTSRQSEVLARASACVARKDIISWFDKWITYMKEEALLEIFDDPDRILNMDESGFLLNPKGRLSIVSKGVREVLEVNSDSKTQMSTSFCLSASGHVFQPCIIYKGKKLSPGVKSSIPDGINYDITDNGWQTAASFIRWIDMLDNELKMRGTKRPVVMFLDNHVSHLSFEVRLLL